MPTARTYDKYSLAGEPFEENKRMYVYVMTPNGNKKVRWYTISEREAQDRKAGITPKNELMDFNARHAFGFREGGYITIYKGNPDEIRDFAAAHVGSFWMNLTFGYYTPAHIPVPSLPSSITPIKLTWEEVKDHDTRMRPHPEIAQLVATKLGTQVNSGVCQGKVGDWLEKDVIIQKNETKTDHFGDKHTHYMLDTDSNMYVWSTGTKNFPVGAKVHLKMRVKDHKENYTVVWYCKEV